MDITTVLGKHLRDVHFGGNWTCSNMKDLIADITWQEATAQVADCNTIAALVFHIQYYVEAVLKVLEGGPLDAHDRFSYDVPAITSESEWKALWEKALSNAEKLAGKMAGIEDGRLPMPFTDEKYGSYLRNFLGLTEHTHYHLGQIALLKRIIRKP